MGLRPILKPWREYQSLSSVDQSLICYCVYAVEAPSTVPAGEEPIEWRLLTSHAVETAEQAVECVEWYKCR